MGNGDLADGGSASAEAAVDRSGGDGPPPSTGNTRVAVDPSGGAIDRDPRTGQVLKGKIMLYGNTVPLPRREIDPEELPGTAASTIPAPRAVESNAHVAAAAYLMKHADVNALAVVDGREPEQAVGVITTADVAGAIADGKNVNDVRIYQLMRPKRA
jgi:hypothetical protein